jgi:hypothetical protein
MTADFTVHNAGSVVAITPVSSGAKDWVEAHLPLEPYQWLGGAFVVDARYAFDILDGIVNDGLAVQS